MPTDNSPVRDRDAMIAGMTPQLDERLYVFCTSPAGLAEPAGRALATFVEEEGITLVLGAESPTGAGVTRSDPMARITLTIHSALDGVGLTAAVAGALAADGVPCNVIAAFHHDHIFVPAGDAEKAMAILLDLQRQAQKR